MRLNDIVDESHNTIIHDCSLILNTKIGVL
jgi:hypothetical protein